jgi:hypothetical protein
MDMKVTVLINTNEREDMFFGICLALTIEAQEEGIDLLIQANLDGCTYDYNRFKDIPIWFTRYEKHGKQYYYALCQKLFADAQKADYYFKIDDDMLLVPNFLTNSIHAWESIEDKYKRGLNILADQRIEMWGSEPKTVVNEYVFLSGWIDLNFMMDNTSFNILKKLELLPPLERITTSSGVGRQVCRHMRWVGNLYQMRETMLIHGDHKSKMNPDRSEWDKIILNNK